MASLPANDRMTGPLIALADQTDLPADFPIVPASPSDPPDAGVEVYRERGGVWSPLTAVTDFAILDIVDTGFTVRLSAGAEAGDIYWIVGAVPPKRIRHHVPGGQTRSDTLEGDARQFAATDQELRRDLARAATAPLGEVGPRLTPEADRGGNVAVWSADGKVLGGDRPVADFDADVAATQASAAAAAVSAAAAAVGATAAAAAEAAAEAARDEAVAATAGKLDKGFGNFSQPDAVNARGAIGVEASVLDFVPFGLQAGIADGTGTVDLTTYMQAFMNAGGGRIPPGRYVHDRLQITNPVRIVAQNATFEQKSPGPVGPAYTIATGQIITRQELWEFNPGSEGSTVEFQGDCWFDGRADLHGGSFVSESRSKWGAVGLHAARVAISGNLQCRRFITFAVCQEAAFTEIERAYIADCAQGYYAGLFRAPETPLDHLPLGGLYGLKANVTCDRIDSGGYPIFQHAADVMYAHVSDIQISIRDQRGSAGSSSLLSGLTVLGCMFSRVVGVHFGFNAANTLAGLALTFVGNYRCVFPDCRAFFFETAGLEDIGNEECTFSDYILDGGYRGASSVGVNLNVGNQYPIWNRSRRRSVHSGLSKHVGGRILRVNWGYFIRCEAVRISDCEVKGSRSHGVIVQEWATENFFGTIDKSRPTRVEIRGLTVENAGGSGASLEKYSDLLIMDSVFRNCGQVTTGGDAARSGIAVAPPAAGSAGRLSMRNNRVLDDQGDTLSVAISFRPQSTTAAHRVSATLLKPKTITIGQNVTIKNGAGPGADVTGYIHDQFGDDVTIQLSGAATLSSTGNTTPLSGTWVTDATDATTLLGTGGAATTQIAGSLWITNGTEWRQVTSSSGNNTLYIDAPFTSPLVAATLNALACGVARPRSMRVGFRLSLTNADVVETKGCTARGAILQNWLVSHLTKMAPGSDYVVEASVTQGNAAQVLVGNFPETHAIDGIAAIVTTAITGSGVTSWNCVIENTSGTTLETVGSTLGLAVNTKVTTATATPTHLAAQRRITAKYTGGTPTGGVIKVGVRCRVPGPEAYSDV